MKKAKIILTSTEFNKQEMLKYYGGLFKTDKILLDKIKVVPLAYDNKKFNLEMPAQPNKFGKYILSIGRLEEKKNTKRIVEAFGLLKPIFADLKLVLVGHPGAGYGAVCEAVNNSKYKDDIIELGYADDVAGVLKNAQVFVFPSLYEGFGIPVLEAMAVGVPVVTSSIPALLEVAGEAVQYANPLNIQAIADKINKFLKDKQFRQEKIECGLKQVEKYSWQNTAETSMKNLLL